MATNAASEAEAQARIVVDAHIRFFSFSNKNVLSDIRFTADAGEALAVLGPSGCGKSTLIRILSGLLPRSRKDSYDGRVCLLGTSPARYRSSGRLAVMFQDPTLLPHLTVEQNILLPLDLLQRDKGDSVTSLVNLVGMQDFRHYLPKELSGGMRTRAALARSFVTNPQLLFMDEPFIGLDLGWKESLYKSLQQLRARHETTVVMVTHDLEEAVYNSNRILIMSAGGRIVDELLVPGQLPREYPFAETVSRHTDILRALARHLSTQEPSRLVQDA